MKKILKKLFGNVTKKDLLLSVGMALTNLAAVFLYREISKENINFAGL